MSVDHRDALLWPLQSTFKNKEEYSPGSEASSFPNSFVNSSSNFAVKKDYGADLHMGYWTPLPTQTALKDSSPSSTEPSSMISDKSSSRGTLETRNFENTSISTDTGDTEHPISEGSLSPPVHGLSCANNSRPQPSCNLSLSAESCLRTIEKEYKNSNDSLLNPSDYAHSPSSPSLERRLAPQLSSTVTSQSSTNPCFYKPQLCEDLAESHIRTKNMNSCYNQYQMSYLRKNNFHRPTRSVTNSFPNSSGCKYGIRPHYFDVEQSAYHRNQPNYSSLAAPERHLHEYLTNEQQSPVTSSPSKRSFVNSYDQFYRNDNRRYVEWNSAYQSYRQKNMPNRFIPPVPPEFCSQSNSLDTFEAKRRCMQAYSNCPPEMTDKRLRGIPNVFVSTGEPSRQRSCIESDIFPHSSAPTEINSGQIKRFVDYPSNRFSKSHFDENLSSAPNCVPGSFNSYNQQIYSTPKPFRGSTEGVKKRKIPTTSRMLKRRRMSYEHEQKERQKASAISETQATLTLIRLLAKSLSQCISTPGLESNIDLYPPEPALNQKIPCHKLDAGTALSPLETNSAIQSNYGKKYSSLPFTIRIPKKPTPNSLLSYLKDGPKNLVTQNNLLNNALTLQLTRAGAPYTSPVPSSPLNTSIHEIDPLQIYQQPHRSQVDADLPLSKIERQCITHYVSGENVAPQLETIGNITEMLREIYPEKKRTVDTLKPQTSCTACRFCAMQVLPPGDKIKNPNSIINSFCSETCMSQFNASTSKQRFSKLALIPHSPNTIYSDHVISKVSVLIQGSSSKLCKNSVKTSCANKLGRRRLCTQEKLDCTVSVPTRRWQGARWMSYSNSHFLSPLPHGELSQSSEKSTWLSPLNAPNNLSDRRRCSLCKECGDSDSQLSGRLLNYGIDKWLHVNCILWCYNTYETLDGCLMNVARSLEKASREKCTHCHLLGAGLPCFAVDCPFVYHLSCAYKIGCSFYEDRSMFCPLHQNQVPSSEKLETLEVSRRVFLSRDEYSLVADVVSSNPQIRIGITPKLRIGSLLLNSIGQLLPEHLESGLFHTPSFIYPVGFSTTRIYWSYRRPGHRCFYTCSIGGATRTINSSEDHWVNMEPGVTSHTSPIFTVTVNDPGFPVENFRAHSCNEVWQHLLHLIQIQRKKARFTSLNLFSDRLLGEDLFGLSESHIVRAIESLPGVEHVRNYIFKFGKMQLITKMPMVVNPSGCARSEPKLRTYIRNKTHDQDLDPQAPTSPSQLHHVCQILRNYSPQSCTAPTGKQSSPIISKFHQYRRLRFDWKNNVLLARSKIQGLGLYAARDIEKHEFIIEYLGQLIRNEVGNKRERLYESQNRGIYMFRADDDCIVDATLYGGLARYVNHSCEPNCIAEVFAFEANKRIIIIAKRLIKKGEELTYDYQFDFEDDKPSRIPCLCGAKLCKKWMN